MCCKNTEKLSLKFSILDHNSITSALIKQILGCIKKESIKYGLEHSGQSAQAGEREFSDW